MTSMKKDTSTSVHAWLVMMKAMQAISRYALADIEKAGLGDSDFRVLEVLLNKGPLPVNVIGPKVNLTPGSISVAVDRLLAKGFVSRTESSEDRRVRVVALTPRGKSVITPVFRRTSRLWKKCLQPFRVMKCDNSNSNLKCVGRQAESLFLQTTAKKGRSANTPI